MKIFSLISLLAFVSLFATAQDTIPNSGFENWTNHGNYEEPTGLNTLNPYTWVIGILSAVKTTAVAEVHSGNYAIKLLTKVYTSAAEPGLVTTGKVNTGAGTIDGGTPINSRPVAVKGWCKYTPSGTDTASLEIHLYKWDNANHTRAEIGTGVTLIDSAVSSWTNFEIPVSYTTNETPDTVKLVFYSSNQNPQLNSALFLDDLSYDFTTGIQKQELLPLVFYPNPAKTQVSIDNTELNATVVSLYSYEGKLVKSFAMHDGLNTLNVSSVVPGSYFLSAINSKGKTRQSALVIE